MPRQQTVQVPKEIEKELTLLRGFRDLMAERTGYYFGAKMLSKTMSEKTENERKAVREAGKGYREAIKVLIETPTQENSTTVTAKAKVLDEAREKNREARKPHLEKISPLRRAIKYVDVVAVPDALKELGVTVQPRFSLSEWVTDAIKKK